jgi:hypothetical protein
LLTALLGWFLVLAAFNQFQPTLLVSLQSFLMPGDPNSSKDDDDQDGDEVAVTVSSASRPHRRRDCPIPPGVEVPLTARVAVCPAAPPRPLRASPAHVPDCRNGIGAHLRC